MRFAEYNRKTLSWKGKWWTAFYFSLRHFSEDLQKVLSDLRKLLHTVYLYCFFEMWLWGVFRKKCPALQREAMGKEEYIWDECRELTKFGQFRTCSKYPKRVRCWRKYKRELKKDQKAAINEKRMKDVANEKVNELLSSFHRDILKKTEFRQKNESFLNVRDDGDA